MATDQTEKVRENRLRRMAERQGLRLEKSRRRDPRAIDYGGWFIFQVTGDATDWRGRQLVTSEYGMSLDDVEKFLTVDKS